MPYSIALPYGNPAYPLAVRENVSVRIERARENVFTITATGQELSALVAGARMAYEAMRTAPEPPPREALELLGRVLSEFDRARQRLSEESPPASDDSP